MPLIPATAWPRFGMTPLLVHALGLLALWCAVTFGLGAVWAGQQTSGVIDLLGAGIAAPFAAGAAMLLVASRLPLWREVLALARPARPGTLMLALPIFFHFGFFALVASLAGPPPAGLALVLLINVMLIGLSEELMFRGFLLEGLRSAFGLRRAILFSTLAFGLLHVPNGLYSGAFDVALAQAVAAFLTGLFLVAMRVRTGSLWPSVLLHGLWNFGTAMMVAGVNQTGHVHERPDSLALAGPILLALPLAIYALRLLRGVGREEGGDAAPA